MDKLNQQAFEEKDFFAETAKVSVGRSRAKESHDLILALYVLESVHPGVHHIVECEAGLHLAIRKGIVLLGTLRYSLALLVIEHEAVGSFGNFDERWLRGRRLREVHGVDKRPIGSRSQ